MNAPASEPAPTAPPREPWSQRTRDRWFFGALALTTLGVLYLFSWFLNVLLFSGVVVVVAWPLYQRVLARCGGRRMLASLLTVTILAAVVFVPLGYLGWLFALEAVTLATMGAAFVSSGELTRTIERLTATTTWLPQWVQDWVPVDFDLLAAIGGPLQDAALSLLNWAGNSIPALLGLTMNAGVDIALFFLAVVTLFAHGPRVLQVVKDLSPMDDAYEERLFAVFGEFANNVVVGSFVTAAVQGAVAGVGYAIAGVDRVVFFAILTGLCGFVPLVGTALIIVPLAVVVGFEHGVGWGVFLLAWAVGIAQLDNVIRPLFMRGSSSINPLLIFLAVFAGLGWLGLPGALIGPAIVAAFLALYTIYAEDYLGRVPKTAEPRERRLPQWMRRRPGRRQDAEAGLPVPTGAADDLNPTEPPVRLGRWRRGPR
jgi:predicted PurR-regulated permease PerM